MIAHTSLSPSRSVFSITCCRPVFAPAGLRGGRLARAFVGDSASTSNAPPVFRPATEADMDTCRRLVLEERMNPLSIDQRLIVVAACPSSGALIGLGQLVPLGPGRSEIRSVVVEKEHRGKGIGAALVQHLCSRTSDTVWITTISRRTQFYERVAGFELVPFTQVPREMLFEALAGGPAQPAPTETHNSQEIKLIQAGYTGADRRVVYECNFSVDTDIAQPFMQYLRSHMREIVCLEEGALFDRATLSIAEQEGGNSLNKTLLVARYRALSRFRLQEYFDRQGERLRADMLEKFGGRFTVERRILVIDCVIE
ncbi:hypothetical protein MNEG_6837 [Monoraphidium neglectum]|uniref:N-acetyltransferase domain-containing protein n=1 Tax=Monoraphidium neglectum TaxID=145388 RepID=A0A0D2JPV1_9CHLO|nr:hypothetical protein MNEG_6837 [Monoraphidium neglectum]KIZ01123.1 hypothetical protein MNEG_6837 [Monoraphidium neglectum]|eukprot:XP_013900142.1 hypothetical protein MNEG_6837 [Monoraphidium neglectum]